MTYLLAELGFAPDAKLLIINSDDFGMCQSGSAGTIKGLTEGFLTSASVLMVCPWANLALEFWQGHPEMSIGVELCLTSEWEVYRWGPITSRDKVPSLLDPEGYFWGNSRLVTQHAKLDEAERELRAQVERALGLGLDVTHLHNHMSSLIFREDLLDLYYRLCREYRLTGREMVRIPNADWAKLTQLIGSDLYYMAMADGKEPKLYEILRGLGAGLYELYPHCAIDGPEIRTIAHYSKHIPEDLDSWRGRVSDTELYTMPRVREFIEKAGFRLTTWRDIRDALRRKLAV